MGQYWAGLMLTRHGGRPSTGIDAAGGSRRHRAGALLSTATRTDAERSLRERGSQGSASRAQSSGYPVRLRGIVYDELNSAPDQKHALLLGNVSL